MSNIFTSSLLISNIEIPDWDCSLNSASAAPEPAAAPDAEPAAASAAPEAEPAASAAAPESAHAAVSDDSYESDGERFQPDAEPAETTLQRSRYDPPTIKNYLILLKVSQKGKDKLVDSCGHSFLFHKEYPGSRTWKCSHRGKKNSPRCNAKVIQKKKPGVDFLTTYQQEDFQFRPHLQQQVHSHPPVYGTETCLLFSARAKQMSLTHPRSKPGAIVNTLLLSGELCDLCGQELPDMAFVKRQIINERVKYLPKEPKFDDPCFSVADGFKAGFYRGTCISSNGRRHHAFASQQMLYHLKFATRWYVDATFFLVDRPIVQLLSINGFVKNDQGKLKQVPLIFLP